MERVIEIIEKYLNGKLYEKDYISRLKNEYNKREFTLDELRQITSFINERKNRRAIDLLMIIFVDKNLFSDEKNNIVVNYEMIDGLLKEFNLKLDRYLIIQLIFKGLINKDNKDAIAINDIRVSKYYDILKDDYKIDYSSKMEKFINVNYHNYDNVDVLNEYDELTMIRDYRLKKDKRALECLYIHNYKLVGKILYELKVPYYTSASDYDFYFGEGLSGLTIAIDKYDLFSGVKLSTFAYNYIRREIKTAVSLSGKQPAVSLDETISDSSDSDEVYNFISSDKGTKQPYSYQGNDNDIASEVADNLDNNILFEVLQYELTKKEFELINDYYYKKESQEEIAKREGVTSKAISLRIKKILKKLRKNQDLKDLASNKFTIEVPTEKSKGENVLDNDVEVKSSKEKHEEPESNSFDVEANARAHLIREFLATYLVEYPDGTYTVIKEEYGKEKTIENMKADIFIKYEKSERKFNNRVHEEIGKKSYFINLIGGFPFICLEDIEKEIYKVKRSLGRIKPSLHDFMPIDDIFYLKIADVVRKDDEQSLEALISLSTQFISEKNKIHTDYHIYSYVRFLANYYYGRPAKTAEIAELLKEVFMTFTGDVPMTTHLKNVVKEKHQEIEKQVELAEEKQKGQSEKRKALNLY